MRCVIELKAPPSVACVILSNLRLAVQVALFDRLGHFGELANRAHEAGRYGGADQDAYAHHDDQARDGG